MITNNRWPGNPRALTIGARTVDAFGPEIGFGWTIGPYLDNPVLFLSIAEAGTSLAVDWQSPTASVLNPVDYSDSEVTYTVHDYGRMWREMINIYQDAIVNLDQYMPMPHSGYEVGGILWLQGWNDAFEDPRMTMDYQSNLSYFIWDLQDTFGNDVPILVGELGQEGPNPWESQVAEIQLAQRTAVANANSPRVVFVPTSPYAVNDEDSAKYDGVHHYNGRADTIMEIGYAFGREIIRQMTLSTSFIDIPLTSPSHRPNLAPSLSPSIHPSAIPSISHSHRPSVFLSSTPPAGSYSPGPNSYPYPSFAPSDTSGPLGYTVPTLDPTRIKVSTPVPSNTFVPSEAPSISCWTAGRQCRIPVQCCSNDCFEFQCQPMPKMKYFAGIRGGIAGSLVDTDKEMRQQGAK
jgi:hypothetical protein